MGRKMLAYTVYSRTRHAMARLKRILEQAGLKVAVLRATVETPKREDWILDQVDRGIDVLITNPDLVKTGLDLLDFPTIVDWAEAGGTGAVPAVRSSPAFS